MYLYVPLYQAILKYETTKNNIPEIWLRSIEKWSYHIKENALFYNATKVLKDVLISFKSYSAINNFIKCKKPYFFVKKKISLEYLHTLMQLRNTDFMLLMPAETVRSNSWNVRKFSCLHNDCLS
jgi:hypothetical protein